MFKFSIILLGLSLLSVFFGAYGIAGITMELSKVLLLIFMAIAFITFMAGLSENKSK